MWILFVHTFIEDIFMKDKIYLFISIIILICKYEKIKRPIVKPYKLRKYTAWCSWKKKLNNYTISYHPDYLADCNTKEIVEIAAHELGHVKYMHSKRLISEYKAQLFALKTIYKYFRTDFSLKWTKKVIKSNKRWYGEAFKRALEEFKIWKKSL